MKMTSLLNLAVVQIFLKTVTYSLKFNRKTKHEKTLIKQAWGRMVLKSFGFEIQVKGIQPTAKSLILVGNHISFLDIPLLMAFLPDITFVAKDDLKKWPVIGSGAEAVGTIFVRRTSGSDRSHVRNQISNVLQNQQSMVAIFPSGTTCLHEEQPWKKGAFEIAKQANVPIQLFKIDYDPLRESAYIENDNLLDQMANLIKIKGKKATLTWLQQFESSGDSEVLAEQLRLKIKS